jgi:DNA-binding beta-propeller fold protein YncE
MQSISRTFAVIAALAACVLAGWGNSNATGVAAAPVQPQLSKELVIYLGCGQVLGAGKVVQLDTAGKVLGTVKLDQTPYGLAAPKEGLLAALPSGQKVVKIDSKGKLSTLLDDPALVPAPIALAVNPKNGDVLVADNRSDVLVLLPAGEVKKRRTILKIQGHEQHLQNMSVGLTTDGYVVFGSSGPQGVFRFKAEDNPALDTQLLLGDAGVAADPTTKRWVAALKQKLVIFEEEREVQSLDYPNGTSKWHDALAFGTDGSLVMALHTGNGYDVVQVDLNQGTFQPLFTWTGERVVCLAVAKKMAWPESEE